MIVGLKFGECRASQTRKNDFIRPQSLAQPALSCRSVPQPDELKEPKAVLINSEPPRPEDGNYAAIDQSSAAEAKLDLAGGNEDGVSDSQRHGKEASVSAGQTSGGQRRADSTPRERSRRSNTFDQLQREVHSKRSVGMR